MVLVEVEGKLVRVDNALFIAGGPDPNERCSRSRAGDTAPAAPGL